MKVLFLAIMFGYYLHCLVVAAAEVSTTSSTTKQTSQSSNKDEIPTFRNDEEDRASDYANYFSAYDDLYHQKMMLTDHNRMVAYHSAIMKNKDLFKDKVVMDVGTGSSILAVWAAQAGAKRVYAVEYTSMADHAKNVVKANGVDDIVKIIRGAVEDVELPLPEEDWDIFCDDENKECKGNQQVVDIIISEWMGYFLLRESMLDSVIYARDKFLKKKTGLLFPSHATMLVAPIGIEKNRQEVEQEYSDAMSSWHEYLERARVHYGVDMSILQNKYEKEQTDYYLLSGHWLQLEAETVLATPTVVKTLDLVTCTLGDVKGFDVMSFKFSNVMKQSDYDTDNQQAVSGFAGWFTVDFQSRTDETGKTYAPEIKNPVYFSTGPEVGGKLYRGIEYLLSLYIYIYKDYYLFSHYFICALRDSLGPASLLLAINHPAIG